MTSVVIVMCERSRPTRVRKGRALAVLAAGAMVLAACGGDGDGDSTTTTTTSSSVPQTPIEPTAAEPTAVEPTAVEPTADPETSTPVRDGATVVVANASRINGSAGRMTERLAAVGYTMGTATNTTAGQIDTTVVYYDPANASAQAVAETLRTDLGGDPVTVEAIPVPPPIEGAMGDATVLVMMGNDTADKTLDELQGIVTESTADTGDTGDDTGGTTGDATTTG